MSHEAKRPKRRVQIHLSTALIMMLAAGLILSANAQQRLEGFKESIAPDQFIVVSRKTNQTQNLAYGFPYTFATRDYYDSTNRESIPRLDAPMLLLNILVGLIGLAMIGYISEWIIRRRSRLRMNEF